MPRLDVLRPAFAAGCALAGCAFLCGCAAPRSDSVSDGVLAMGSFASVTVPSADRALLPAALRAAHETFQELENALSLFKPQSDIVRLNQAAGTQAVTVTPATLKVLTQALNYSGLTGGAFDITVGPLVRFWGFNRGPAPREFPSAASVQAQRARCGYAGLRLTNGAAFLARSGMQVDLGAIGKGFAVDEAFERLRRSGCSNALVNLSGNMRALGQPCPNRRWRIGVRDPFQSDAILGTLELADAEAVATSGNYEKFVVIAGRRQAHIIDPRSGYPVSGMAGVTIVSPNATEADALSTALFVLGPDASLAVLDRLPGNVALFVPDRQPLEILLTPGMAERFKPLPQFRRAVKVLRPREMTGLQAHGGLR
jgi:thiamine biosynthesis lipoprotein ApbE